MLRKIMRRAMRNARMIGVEEPFLYELTGFVAELMRPAYPELMESVQRVARVVKDEEHRYATTFLVAEKMFNDEVKSLADHTHPRRGLVQALRHLRPGARRAGRDGARARPRPSIARASSARWTSSASAPAPVGRAPRRAPSRRLIRSCSSKGRTNFLGYERSGSHLPASIGLLVDQQLVDRVEPGAHGRAGARPDAVLRRNRRPGRRSAARSIPQTGEKVADVETAYPAVPGLTVHRITVARADPRRRRAARRSGRSRCATPPCATTPPRTCCTPRCARCSGTHVKQAGSVVEPAAPALRFHALHRHGPRRDRGSRAADERARSCATSQVETDVMPLDQAISTGAMALFGEKYGDHVRVVSDPRFQQGAVRRHARHAAPAISASARSSTKAASRPACAASKPSPAKRAVRQYQESTDALHRLAEMMHVSEPELVEHVEKMLAAAEGRWRNRSSSSRTSWRNRPSAIWKRRPAR